MLVSEECKVRGSALEVQLCEIKGISTSEEEIKNQEKNSTNIMMSSMLE